MNSTGHNFLYNTGKDNKTIKNETVKVCIRVRPLLQHEDTEFWIIDENKNTISTINSSQAPNKYSNELSRGESYSMLMNKDKDIKKVLMDSIYSPQSFAFDKIYSTSINSQLIYKETCRNITKSVLSGYNGTIFMYGQTTSGKTFTMLGTPNSPGILPCALRDIFNLIQKEKNPNSFNVYCSYIEIYNENLNDLLTDSNNLKLVDDNKYGVIVSGAKRIKIKSFEDGITLKDFGEENRKYRETLINEYSSRSHAIFQIFIETEYFASDNAEGIRYSCLNLVDLAGSERLNDYDTKTEAFGETGYINKSLFVLANVVNKLAESKHTYIPYRDSKLTRLLSQALGGNSLTAIICTVSPAALNYYQTLSTLRFATRAKIVKTKAKVNEYMDEKGAIEFYKNEIRKLQEELKSKNIPNSNITTINQNTNNPYDNNLGLFNEKNTKELLERFMKTNESLTNELENYKEKYINEKERNEIISIEMEKLKNVGVTNNNVSEIKSFNGGGEKNSNLASSASIPIVASGMNLNYDYSKKSDSNLTNINNEINHNINNLQDRYQVNYEEIQPQQSINNFNNNKNPSNYQVVEDNGDEMIKSYSIQSDINNLENAINKIAPFVEKNRNNNQWREETKNLLANYKTDLITLQNKYKEKLKDTFSKIFTNSMNNSEINTVYKILSNNIMISSQSPDTRLLRREINSSFGSGSDNYNLNSYDAFNNDTDEVIKKIKGGLIFYDIQLIFNQNSYDTFENNLKFLKKMYENKVDSLEKNMDYFKSYLENYYRKKIQKTRNHLDNMEFANENIPIMSITSEHNEKLKLLRELYDIKLKELEQTFFDNLKIITASKMSKNTDS